MFCSMASNFPSSYGKFWGKPIQQIYRLQPERPALPWITCGSFPPDKRAWHTDTRQHKFTSSKLIQALHHFTFQSWLAPRRGRGRGAFASRWRPTRITSTVLAAWLAPTHMLWILNPFEEKILSQIQFKQCIRKQACSRKTYTSSINFTKHYIFDNF